MTIKDERGAALPLALMLMFILSLLGTALLQYGTSEAKQVADDMKKMQAYYIARAGADAVTAWMENPDNDGEALIEEETSAGTSLGAGAISKVRVYYKDPADPLRPNGVVIESTGRVEGFERTVIRTMTKTESGEAIPEFDMALFSMGKIFLSGSAAITGNVGTNAVLPESIELNGNPSINGNVSIGPTGDPDTAIKIPWGSVSTFVTGVVNNLSELRSYPLPPFPDYPDDLENKSSLTVEGGPDNDLTISSDGYYPSITIRSNRELTIELGGGERKIRVGDLNVEQGHIVLQGEGKLTLYIENTFTLGGSSTINVNVDARNNYSIDGVPGDLFIYYSGGSEVSAAGATRCIGSIYIERAPVTITGSGGIVGHIIAGGTSVQVTGDASADVRALYAPNAIVNVGGSGHIRGAVIAKEYYSDGAGSVIYDASVEDTFPSLGEMVTVFKPGLWK